MSSHAALGLAHATSRVSHGWTFVAGGLLRLEDFKRDLAGYFDDYAAEPGEVDGGFNPLEARVYQQAAPPGARVLVIGCGSGRDLLPFVAAGHDVVGIEPAEQPAAGLRSLLQQRGSRAEIVSGFIEDAAITGSFDTVIFSPHCYSYIPGSARRVEVLRKVRGHLNPGGRLVLNFLRRTSSWSPLGVRLASAVATLSRSDCPWEPHDVAHLFESPRGRALVFHHYFLPAEVHAEGEQAGLRLVHGEVDSFLGAIAVMERHG